MTNTIRQRDLFTRRYRNVAVPQKEAAFHIQLVSILRWCIKPTVIWRHVPNGEHRDPRTAAKLKAMGVLPGSADLEFFYCSRESESAQGGNTIARHHQDEAQNAIASALRVLFLELKRRGGQQSEAQAAFALAMRCLGAEYHVVRSIEQAVEILGERGLIRPGVEVCGKRWGYDGNDDVSKSFEEAYRAIRERKAAGGKGWEPK